MSQGKKRRATTPPASSGSFISCPACGKDFPEAFVQNHAWRCLDSNSGTSINHVTPRTIKQRPRPSGFVECPTCGESFAQHFIHDHAWHCTTNTSGGISGNAVPLSENDKKRPSRTSREPVRSSCARYSSSVAAGLSVGAVGTASSSYEISASRDENSCKVREDGGVGFRSSGQASAEFLLRRSQEHSEGGDISRVNAIQKLMEGSKRAVLVEKEAKVVPRSWPVELIEDILPSDAADRLLARLLVASKEWTCYPWFNNNGVEGRSHSRSCIYRIFNDDNGGNDRQVNGDTGANDASALAPTATFDPPAAASPRVMENFIGNCDVGTHTHQGDGPCVVTIKEGFRAASFSHQNSTVKGGFDTKRDEQVGFDSHGDVRGDGENGRKHNVETKARPGGRRVRLDSAQRIEVGMREAGRVAGMTQCKLTAEAEAALFRPSKVVRVPGEREDRQDSATVGGDAQDVAAPPELLEIVPKIVEVVRRHLRDRVREGFGGEENLNWSPNFCICNVYDDHRSYIGAHSDTLSNIGPGAIVTGISLGAKRTFVVQETLPWGTKAPPVGDLSGGQKKLLDMRHNSAVVMWGGCQERYKHGVPPMRKGVEVHPVAGTKRISITLRERKESLPQYLLPIPSCNCGVPAILKARVLENEDVEYYYGCDRGQGQCGFWAPKARAK